VSRRSSAARVRVIARVVAANDYDWIHEQAPEWQQLCARRSTAGKTRKLRMSRGSTDGRVINRRRYGDWEGDTIVGKRRRSALLTMVERKSGYARIGRVDGMNSDLTMRAAKRRLKDLPPSLRRSMTFDNGKEFAKHPRLTWGLGLDVYFADPYASWQRGANENMNGLLRQFFPQGTDFTRISHHEVARVEQLLNERRRKRLGYRTPEEILQHRFCRN
jgi:IS30 family transposase